MLCRMLCRMLCGRPEKERAPTDVPILGRRSVLRMAVALPVVAGVWSRSGCSSDSPEPPDPDRVSVQEALAAEEALAATIGSWPAAGGYETNLVASHTAALRETLGMSAPPTTGPTTGPTASFSATSSPTPAGAPSGPSTGSSAGSTTALSDVVRAAHDAERSHLRALTTVSAAVSPLLASLAASDAALAQSLAPSSPWLPVETQAS
jgi:hypothetical protein